MTDIQIGRLYNIGYMTEIWEKEWKEQNRDFQRHSNGHADR